METQRRTVKLGKATVNLAGPEASAYRLWDSELKWFGLKVSPLGLKTYFVWYRVGEGRAGQRREFTLGRHGVLTPDEARDEAVAALAAVRRGEDPQAARERARGELDVAALCDRYLKEGLGQKKATTIAADTARIRAHIKPLLGKRPLSSITTNDVSRSCGTLPTARPPRRSRLRPAPCWRKASRGRL